MEIHLNMYQTLAVAVLVLLFGNFLRHRIGFLEKFCIPAPVIGGLFKKVLTYNQCNDKTEENCHGCASAF